MKSFASLPSILLILAGTEIGCSGSSPQTPIDTGVGGSGGTTAAGGAQTGGISNQATGGATAVVQSTGGTSAVGSTSSAGGGQSTGGVGPATGGTVSGTGGRATGGAATSSTGGRATGGATNATGGNPPTGGSVSAGGSNTTGGKSTTGGANPTGGSNATGGMTSAGGAATGGASATGGTTSNGTMPTVYTTENTGSNCTVRTTFPAFSALTAVANLPDPFLMESGTRISTKAEWECRRAEISAEIQHWELGTKPAPPSASNLTATYSGGNLSVTVTVGSKSVTLTSTITTPTGAGPFPLLIRMDGSGVPATGVATMSFTSSQLAAQMPTRGSGEFWTLFPDNTAGAYAGWVWGVSRLIDGLYKTATQNKIDLNHIGVTGCSYAGKMALYAGAFDERIALTIPEESGGGGEAAWRVSSTLTGAEDLDHAQGTGWYSSLLTQFHNADAPKLPFDQHGLVAMVAPRAILTIGNSGIDYLASQAGQVSVKAATQVYTALGVPDRIGYSISGNHTHCAFPSEQTAQVQAFVDKFLLGKTANTNITTSPYNPDMTKWVTWSTPTLQ